MAILRRPPPRRLLVRMEIRPGFEQDPDRIGVPVLGRPPQRLIAPCMDIGPAVKQHP